MVDTAPAIVIGKGLFNCAPACCLCPSPVDGSWLTFDITHMKEEMENGSYLHPLELQQPQRHVHVCFVYWYWLLPEFVIFISSENFYIGTSLINLHLQSLDNPIFQTSKSVLSLYHKPLTNRYSATLQYLSPLSASSFLMNKV